MTEVLPQRAAKSGDDRLDGDLLMGLLVEIEQQPDHSQRHFAARLGIAVGLVNAYLKRCVRKGFVKMAEVPSRRYAYYLTAKGFSEKSRLVAEYLHSSLDFFRQARAAYSALFASLPARPLTVAIAGRGDLAEIALLSAREAGVALAGFVELGSNQAEFHGLPVVAREEDLSAIDLIILADSSAPQATYDRLARLVGAERLVVPALLRVAVRTKS